MRQIRFSLISTLVLLLTACFGGTAPVKEQEDPEAVKATLESLSPKEDEVQTLKQQPLNEEEEALKPVIVDLEKSNKYLPKQKYDFSGNKIPYIPDPNPYLANPVEVSEEVKQKFAQGQKLIVKQDYKAAKKIFRALTKSNKELSGVWMKMAEIEERQAEGARKIFDREVEAHHLMRVDEYYNKSLEVNPNNVNAYLKFGLFQRRYGKFSQAQNTYVNGLKVWKDFPEAQLNLAILYDMYLNQPEKSVQHYEAYLFLSNDENKDAKKWYSEVRRRTKIDKKFVDDPPKKPEPVVVAEPVGDATIEGEGGAAPLNNEDAAVDGTTSPADAEEGVESPATAAE